MVGAVVGGIDVGLSDGTLVGEEVGGIVVGLCVGILVGLTVGFGDVGLFVGVLVEPLKTVRTGLSHAVFDGLQAHASSAKGHESR